MYIDLKKLSELEEEKSKLRRNSPELIVPNSFK